MGLRDITRTGFLRLPPSTRRAVLGALGRRGPWDPRFDRHAPGAGPGLVTGPPDFVGVGVQKAGTTWWYSLLALHPDVYDHVAFHKERHFFSPFWAGGFGPGDVAEYHRWFPRPPGQLTGEWTPDYLHQHWVAPLLRRSAPEARIMVLLRDPVDRYRSGLAHHLEHGERITPLIASDAFVRGLYADALGRLEVLYGADRVLVLQYEAYRDAPAARLAETLRFLGLDDTWQPPDLRSRVNPTRVPKVDLDEGECRHLAELYADDVARLGQRYPHLDLDRWPSAMKGQAVGGL
ncbi:MAG: sulfotransferase domain-containing protein [Acidimicrobiales bacterium]